MEAEIRDRGVSFGAGSSALRWGWLGLLASGGSGLGLDSDSAYGAEGRAGLIGELDRLLSEEGRGGGRGALGDRIRRGLESGSGDGGE